MDQTEKKESYWSRGGTTTRYSVIQFTSSISHFYYYYCQLFYFFNKKKKRTKIMKNPIAEYPSWTWQVSSVRNQGWRLFLSRQRAKVMVLRGDMQLRRKSIHFDVFTLIFFPSEARFATFFCLRLTKAHYTKSKHTWDSVCLYHYEMEQGKKLTYCNILSRKIHQKLCFEIRIRHLIFFFLYFSWYYFPKIKRLMLRCNFCMSDRHDNYSI